MGQVPVYHVGRGGRGNVVGEEREDGGEVTRRRGTWIRVLAGKRI